MDYLHGLLMGFALAVPAYLFLDRWVVPWLWDEFNPRRAHPPRGQ